MTTIGYGAFRDCVALTEVDIPSAVRTVGKRAFADCTRLEAVRAESGLERIGAFAFAGCDRLKSITVPNTLKHIGIGAFGFGRVDAEDRITLLVESEYMKRRLCTKLRLALCSSRVEIVVTGKSIEERRRERRRAQLEQKPAHLFDPADNTQKEDEQG